MGSVALSSLVAANAKSAAQMVLIMPPTQQVAIRTTNHNLLAAGGAQVTFSLLSLLCVCVINTLLASGVFILSASSTHVALFTIIHTACSASCSSGTEKNQQRDL
jgi:hypothetical protein